MSVENWHEPIEAREWYEDHTNPEVLRVFDDGSAAVTFMHGGARHACIYSRSTCCWRNVPKPKLKRETVEEVRKAYAQEWDQGDMEIALIERMARAVFHEEMGRRGNEYEIVAQSSRPTSPQAFS